MIAEVMFFKTGLQRLKVVFPIFLRKPVNPNRQLAGWLAGWVIAVLMLMACQKIVADRGGRTGSILTDVRVATAATVLEIERPSSELAAFRADAKR